jgi:hypothetical protein
MILAPMVLTMLAMRRESTSQPVDTHLHEEAQAARAKAEQQRRTSVEFSRRS